MYDRNYSRIDARIKYRFLVSKSDPNISFDFLLIKLDFRFHFFQLKSRAVKMNIRCAQVGALLHYSMMGFFSVFIRVVQN